MPHLSTGSEEGPRRSGLEALPVAPGIEPMEAKLVGINLPLFKGRNSVDAQYVALRRRLVGGLSRDLEDAGLLKVFASRALEDKWTDELFELNRGGRGNPGLTKDAQALTIAKTIQKWQR